MKLKQQYQYVVSKLKNYLRRLKANGENMSNVELAKIFKVSPSMIGKWLKGIKPMSPKNCIILAETINEKPEKLIMTMLMNSENDIETKKKLKKIIDRL